MGTGYVSSRNAGSRTDTCHCQRICTAIRVHVRRFSNVHRLHVVNFDEFFSGNYSEALINYEKGINYQNADSLTVEQQEHVKLCLSGIARSSIKHGDYRKGVSFLDMIFQ